MTPTHVLPHDDHYAREMEDEVSMIDPLDWEAAVSRIPPVAPGTEPPRERRRSMAVIVYGAFAAGGALVGLVAGWVLRGMW